MISGQLAGNRPTIDPSDQEVLLVVEPPNRNHSLAGNPINPPLPCRERGRGEGFRNQLAPTLRAWYPTFTIRTCDTYLSAIADASRRPIRAVLGSVDTSLVHFEEAVAGLRDAVGADPRIVLVCEPHAEWLARRAARSGANDYVLEPLRLTELDRALQYERPRENLTRAFARTTTVSMAELAKFGELFAHIDDAPTPLLRRLADLLRDIMNARGATVSMEAATATSGDPVINPVLAAPLFSHNAIAGQMVLAERMEGAYTPNDVEKLKHFASLTTELLSAASKYRMAYEQAVTDACSGLPNRRLLTESLDRILSRAQRERFPVTLLIFDIDNFKEYNDRYGHGVGDRIIRNIGSLFRRLCREQDVVARFGGDEFAVVFWDPDGPRVPGSEHPDSAMAVLDRVRDALRTQELELGPRSVTDQTAGEKTPTNEVRLTISGGLATYPWDAITPEELVARADDALLNAKRAGKNRIYTLGT